MWATPAHAQLFGFWWVGDLSKLTRSWDPMMTSRFSPPKLLNSSGYIYGTAQNLRRGKNTRELQLMDQYISLPTNYCSKSCYWVANTLCNDGRSNKPKLSNFPTFTALSVIQEDMPLLWACCCKWTNRWNFWLHRTKEPLQFTFLLPRYHGVVASRRWPSRV